ncbi:hypothetical protein QCA50_012673 [Cerrena zonata]|uniref:Uncharacterized protein n=1 Tax=Cerrena zonata TaxID=2478898 RepID=A0AAW0FZ38_9APHY
MNVNRMSFHLLVGSESRGLRLTNQALGHGFASSLISMRSNRLRSRLDCFDLCKDLDPTAVPFVDDDDDDDNTYCGLQPLHSYANTAHHEDVDEYNYNYEEEDETYQGLQPLHPAINIVHDEPSEAFAPDAALTLTQPIAEAVMQGDDFQLSWDISRLPTPRRTLESRYGLNESAKIEGLYQVPESYTVQAALLPFVERMMEEEEATLSPHFREVLQTFSYAIRFDNIDKVTPALVTDYTLTPR